MTIKDKKEILFGTLLGNSNLQTYTGGKTWRARFIQKDKSYLFHLYNIFQNHVSTGPKQSLINNGKYSRWTFNTKVNLFYLEFALLFYVRTGSVRTIKKKVLPNEEILNKYLTPQAIAYWFMDDGSLKSNYLAYYLCTDNFTKEEVLLLGSIFLKKYNIRVNYHKNRSSYRIYIPRPEYWKFRDLIEIYIIDSMKYKL